MKISDDDLSPVKDGMQCPSWQLFYRILLISRCLRMEIVTKGKTLRNYYQDVQCGPSFVGTALSVHLITPLYAQRLLD